MPTPPDAPYKLRQDLKPERRGFRVGRDGLIMRARRAIVSGASREEVLALLAPLTRKERAWVRTARR